MKTDASRWPVAWQTDARYRVVPEHRIIAAIQLESWNMQDPDDERRSHAGARDVLDRLVRLGLPSRQLPSGPHFDPIEVSRLSTLASLTGRDFHWTEQKVPEARRRYLSFSRPGFSSRQFRIGFRRSWALAGGPANPSRLRCPTALATAQQRVQHHVVTADDGLNWRLGSDRLEARSPGEPRPVEVATEIIMTDYDRLDAEPGPLKRYLAPKEGLIEVTKEVSALATRLAQGLSPRDAVDRFWIFCIDHLRQSPVHYDEFIATPAVDLALERGWADCQVASALFAALCRAKAIPARLIGGHLLYPTSPAYHHWIEVWIDGAWRPHDFLAWILSFGGRDEDWRDVFRGKLEARLVTQIMPLRFLGNPGVSGGPSWIMVPRPIAGGVEIAILDGDNGAPLLSDAVTVSELD